MKKTMDIFIPRQPMNEMEELGKSIRFSDLITRTRWRNTSSRSDVEAAAIHEKENGTLIGGY